MNQLLKVLLLSLSGIISLEALEVPNFLRGAGPGRELAHVTTLSHPVFATLVTGLTDLSELCYSLNTLLYALGDPDAPVIIFYDTFSSNLLDGHKNTLQGCTVRPVSFHPVDFGQFPEGFIKQPGRDYTYEQSQRFFISGMWKEPALEPYDVILRFSDTSCLSFNNTVLPYMDDDHVYHGHYVPGAYEIARKYSKGLYEKAYDYISLIGAHPLEKTMWSKVVTTHTDFDTVPVMRSGFEVVRKSFIQRPDVSDWLNYFTELPPFGIYESRWGTNAERYITLAIFADETKITLSPIPGFVEKDFVRQNFYRAVCRPFARGNEYDAYA